MGRKSIKEDKCIYQIKREELGLSREKAAMLLETVSEDRIYRIEAKRIAPHPDEVLVMAEKYHDPSLCNHYCANQCPIGRVHSVETKIKDLPVIVLETIASLNAIERYKDRLIEIASDCTVNEDEAADFSEIQNALRKISTSVESLRLWAEQQKLSKPNS